MGRPIRRGPGFTPRSNSRGDEQRSMSALAGLQQLQQLVWEGCARVPPIFDPSHVVFRFGHGGRSAMTWGTETIFPWIKHPMSERALISSTDEPPCAPFRTRPGSRF
jgi:hypothetical protein